MRLLPKHSSEVSSSSTEFPAQKNHSSSLPQIINIPPEQRRSSPKKKEKKKLEAAEIETSCKIVMESSEEDGITFWITGNGEQVMSAKKILLQEFRTNESHSLKVARSFHR